MSELEYVALLFGLFVLPRVLLRYRIPAAVSSLALGAAAGLGLGWFRDDTTVHLLSTFGISALFLFAGLEVDADALLKGRKVIAVHLLTRGVVLAGGTVAAVALFQLPARVAALVALAVLTPSTGFILDSIDGLGLGDDERFWVKTKAIAAELFALAVLFVTLQSTTWTRLALSTAALLALIAVLPLVFRAFAKRIVPIAPKSEFGFLLILAVVCAFATRKLGVYYLVGAFLVGVAAQRFRRELPAIASEDMVQAVERFASFFIPFYFFAAGVDLRRSDFGWHGLVVGAALVVVLVPARMGSVLAQRWFLFREAASSANRIAISLLPTLVFGLVLIGILKDRFGVEGPLIGGLVVYTVVTTLVPSFFLRATQSFEEPHAPHVSGPVRPPANDRV